LGLSNGLFPSGFPIKNPYTPLLSPIHATCPAHLLHLTTRIIFRFAEQISQLALCSFLHSPVTSSLLTPNILLSTLFSNTLSLRSTPNVSDQSVNRTQVVVFRFGLQLFCLINTIGCFT
jgi:hypothetical protein